VAIANLASLFELLLAAGPPPGATWRGRCPEPSSNGGSRRCATPSEALYSPRVYQVPPGPVKLMPSAQMKWFIPLRSTATSK